MPTSELSEALNPHFSQTRRPSHVATDTPPVPDVQHQFDPSLCLVDGDEQQDFPQFTPHRSELEDAMNPVIVPQVSASHTIPPQT